MKEKKDSKHIPKLRSVRIKIIREDKIIYF